MPWTTPDPWGTWAANLPHVPGRFYDWEVGGTTTLTLVANTLYGAPFLVPVGNTYTSINLEVTTLAGGKSIRLGIYTDTNGAPNALVLDAGTISAATTGGKQIVISQVLSPGWYWLAGVSDGTPGVRANAGSGAVSILGFSSGTSTTTSAGVSVSFT